MVQPQTYPNKPKNRSPLNVIVNGWGCFLSLFMLGMGIIVGLGIAIVVAPQVFGFQATATALAEDAFLLIATQVELDSQADNLRGQEQNLRARETNDALNHSMTQAALSNREQLVGQTETAVVVSIMQTQTQAAVINVQQRTRVAIDFAATQARLEQNATQVELDYRNTQAALNGVPVAVTNTPIVLELPPTGTPLPTVTMAQVQAQSLPTSSPTQALVVRASSTTPPNIILPPSDTPVASSNGQLQANFRQWTAIQPYWRLSSSDDWAVTNEGLAAQRDDAWLLSEAQANALITVDFKPALVMESQYIVLLQTGDTTGYALQISAPAGLSAKEVAVYRYSSLENVLDEYIISTDLDNLLRAESRISLSQQGERLFISLNDATLLIVDIALSSVTQIGVNFPQGAILQQINVDVQP